jgi:hypothetical protein
MQGKVRLLMSLEDLRAHRGHVYAEYDTWCGYCWLESEATAGEPGGGGYDYYVPISELTQEQVHASHEAALGSGGEYAPEPAYYNPFALVGSIGGFSDLRPDYPGFMDIERDERLARVRRQYWMDACLAMSVRIPLPLCIITGIS